MDKLTETFCVLDDFCQYFIPEWNKQLLENDIKKRRRSSKLSYSEIMTIMVCFHQSRFRDFKTYYTQYVNKYLKQEFPNLVSYNRFVELMPSVLMPLCFFIACQQKTPTGIYFVDSTLLKVCHIKRHSQNRVFKKLAKKSRSTMGWFYGFKLHLIINDKGEIMAFKLTAGNVDDRHPLKELAKGLMGKIVGDKGYISQELFEELYKKGLQLITRIKKNMKNKLMPIFDKILLRKRAIIESVNDQLKNISQIEHTRHRSPTNFLVNLVSGLVAYSLQKKKPSLDMSNNLLLA